MNACVNADHRQDWRVTVRRANYSAFNGRHRTPSAYSEVVCLIDSKTWRTKAGYVASTPNITEDDYARMRTARADGATAPTDADAQERARLVIALAAQHGGVDIPAAAGEAAPMSNGNHPSTHTANAPTDLAARVDCAYASLTAARQAVTDAVMTLGGHESDVSATALFRVLSHAQRMGEGYLAIMEWAWAAVQASPIPALGPARVLLDRAIGDLNSVQVDFPAILDAVVKGGVQPR